jgi:hypothetical protein
MILRRGELELQNDVLKAIVDRTPDVPLYHYTNQSGLLGIVKDQQIWATHHQYLNDREEFLHAVRFVKDEIESLLDGGIGSGPDGDSRRNILNRMKAAITRSSWKINICVASFSERGDSLSQWRGYSGRTGFAIGFWGSDLKAIAEAKGWYLAACEYDWERQRRIVKELINTAMDELTSGRVQGVPEPDDGYDRVGNFVSYLYRFAPILKNHAFTDEKEWRIISPILPCTTPGFDYREGSSTIVPFFRFPLFDHGNNFQIHEVVVGPANDEDRSEYAVSSLLASRHLWQRGGKSTLVRMSKVPFRDW